MKNQPVEALPDRAVVVSLNENIWRIARHGAADMSEERGRAITAIEWLQEAIIERDLAQRLQVRAPGLTLLNARSLAEVQHDYLLDLMQTVGYNVSRAAKVAGIERHTIARLLRKYNIRCPSRPGRKARPRETSSEQAEAEIAVHS